MKHKKFNYYTIYVDLLDDIESVSKCIEHYWDMSNYLCLDLKNVNDIIVYNIIKFLYSKYKSHELRKKIKFCNYNRDMVIKYINMVKHDKNTCNSK